MRRIIGPLVLSFLILPGACDKDGCECLKKSYDYGGDYPIRETEEVDCPGDLADGDDLIVWDEANDRIDYIISKTCL